MKLCYQVATPEVARSGKVTAYQGPLGNTLCRLKDIGYDGVEFMTVDPGRLDWSEVKALLAQTGMAATIVCTGEVFGQLRLSITDPDSSIRRDAVDRVKEIIAFAGVLGANINIGRVRGSYRDGIAKEQTEEWAIEACRDISEYAAERKVSIALEEVCFEETNFINTLAQAREFMTRVNRSNFRLMMDVFHMHIEEKSIEEGLREYTKDTINIHLADSNRKYPGQCALNFDNIVRTCVESGYHGPFCTEIFQYPDMDTAAVRSYAHLVPLFEKYYGRARWRIKDDK